MCTTVSTHVLAYLYVYLLKVSKCSSFLATRFFGAFSTLPTDLVNNRGGTHCQILGEA